MMFPLASTMEFSTAATLGIAVLLGFGFGFCLERAGFGSARKLTAVFYLYDMAVVKVMFSAIVTAMVGLFVLSAIGVLDLKELYLEPTNLAAQALGGLVFGAGFIVGGYCPGTSIAAIATGRKDGIMLRTWHARRRVRLRRNHARYRGLDQGDGAGRDDAPFRDGPGHGLVHAGVRRVPPVRCLGMGASKADSQRCGRARKTRCP